jgi:hypothetical protein
VGNENLIPVTVTVSSSDEHEESNDTLEDNEQVFNINVTGNATLHIDGWVRWILLIILNTPSYM